MGQPRPPLVARILSESRREWLAKKRAHVWLAFVSALLCASSLGIGLQLDDHFHHLFARGAGPSGFYANPPHALDLFRFLDGSPEKQPERPGSRDRSLVGFVGA